MRCETLIIKGLRLPSVLLLMFALSLCGVQAQPHALTLAEAMQQALVQSPALAQSQARIDQSVARLSQANAAYWPIFSLPASYSQQSFADASTLGALSQSDSAQYYRVGLSASWTLFDGLARRGRSMSAEQLQLQAASAYEDSQRLLLGGVSFAYHAAQLTRENLRIALADEAYNKSLLKEAQARLDAGAGSRSDVLNFEVRMNAASSEVIREQQNLRVTTAALAETIGQPDAALPEGMDLAELEDHVFTQVTRTNTAAQIAIAREARPDLRAAWQGRESRVSEVKVAKGDLWPTLGLGASIDGERLDDPSFESGDFGNWVGLSLNYTFADGGQRRGRVREAQALVDESDAVARAIEIRVALDIQQAQARLDGAQERLTLQVRNAATVAENRDLIEREFRTGNTSLVRLNEAQRDLISAQGQLALARVAFQQAQIDLAVATGEILRHVQAAEKP